MTQIVVPLVVVIVGLALSSRIGDNVGNIFSGLTDSEGTQAIGGFVLIFLGLFVIGAVAGFWLRMVLSVIPLFGLANRMAGMAAAVVIGFVMLSGILTGVQKFNDRFDDDIEESSLGAFLADNFDVVTRGVKLIPSDWDDQLPGR